MIITKHRTSVSPLRIPASMRPDLAERRIRQVCAWMVLFLLLEAELGLAWDRRWHDYVGRDQFWIPPHIMMYVGIASTGLISLCVVLLDTLRYRQKKAGVNDRSTVSIVGWFHAPLGFILLGVGTLIDLLAAPFDNYWHQLYGIDVTLWAPFHLMGVFGGVMAGLGIIYVFASEAVPAVVVPPVIAHALAPVLWLPPDVVHVLEPGWLNMLVSLPFAMVVGAISASLGTVLGDIWNWNER